jgi:hypothetical protein
MKNLLIMSSSFALFVSATALAQNLPEIEHGIVELENGDLGVTKCGAILDKDGKTYKLLTDLDCPGISHSCPADEATECKNRAVVTIPGRNITFMFNKHTISIEPRTSAYTNFSASLRKGYDTIVWSTGSHNTIVGSTENNYGTEPSLKSINNSADILYAPQTKHNVAASSITGIKLGSSHADNNDGHNKVHSVGCGFSHGGTCFQVSNSDNYLFGNTVSGGTIGFQVGIPESEKTGHDPIIHSNRIEQNNVTNPAGKTAFLLTSQLPAHMLDNLDVYNVYIYNVVSETNAGFVIENASGHLAIKNLAFTIPTAGFDVKETEHLHEGIHNKNYLIANDVDSDEVGIRLSADAEGVIAAFNIAVRNSEDIHNAANDPHCIHNKFIFNWANPKRVNFSCVLDPIKDQKLFNDIETLMSKY